jgi:hypothetical protein
VHRSRFHHLVLSCVLHPFQGGWQILAEDELRMQEENYFVEDVVDVTLVTQPHLMA